MKRLIYTFRYLTRNRGNNLIRILSMTLGLVVGAILLSQVAFDTSFDRFYPDADRIYQARFVWVGENEDDVADGLFGEPWSVLRDELPGTVSGTMFFPQRNLRPFYYEDHPHVFQGLYHADSVFFDFFGVKLTQGDLRSGFLSDRNIFLSGSCAERMFGGRNPVGEIVFYDKSAPYTVAGVFEDFPKNSTLSFDALIPLRNIAPFTDINGWRPNMKWGGTDCFRGYVKLVPGANPDSVNADLRKICRKYADTDEVFYRLYPVTQLHRDNADVRHHVFIRSLLAFIVLLVAAMNYALASISSLATRARTMAMYKCNGNTSSGIFGMMLSDSAYGIVLSLGCLAFLKKLKPKGMMRDLALVVPTAISHEAIVHAIQAAASEDLKSVTLFDRYDGEQVAQGMSSMAYSLAFQNNAQTLTDEVVEKDMAAIITACRDLGATVRE